MDKYDANFTPRTISFRTTETAYEREIELAACDLVLYSASGDTNTMPSSFPFAIPLTQDTPQCIHTPHSSLCHTLFATLHPLDTAQQPLSKSLTVHTRRYTSHTHTLDIAPEMHSLDDPTRIEIVVPRATFKVGEPIPIYVTIPPPRTELVVEQGLRLRNIKAEFIRVIKVRREDDDNDSIEIGADLDADVLENNYSTEEGPSTAAVSATVEESSPLSSREELGSPLFRGASYKTIVSRSGASCRFHSSQPIRLRFILQPSDLPRNVPDGAYGYLGGDTHCASITQTSLTHTVTFRVNIHASFVDVSNRTERFSTVSIPLLIIPPPAPLPEVEDWVDAAYQKKHDRPPAKTVRLDDTDISAPRYHEGGAGPSAQQGGAPPPFEERDEPPPFFFHAAEASTSSRHAPPSFSHAPEASTSSRLPTFLESETEIFIPSNTDDIALPPLDQPIIAGEGQLFGFSPSQQFDGHSEDTRRCSTPPPTLEMASRDTNLTNLADLHEPQYDMEALTIALEQQHEAEGSGELPPPPPPAMDDPSDPPPSIDSDFRSPDIHLRHSPPPHSSPSPRPVYNQDEALRNSLPSSPHPQNHGHAPPPYLIPGNGGDQEHVAWPPPYMDLMPLTPDRH